MSKWNVEELVAGKTVEAVFWPNPTESSQFKLRATHLDGRRAPKTLARQLEISVEALRAAVIPSERQAWAPVRPIVHFDGQTQAQGFSVRRALARTLRSTLVKMISCRMYSLRSTPLRSSTAQR